MKKNYIFGLLCTICLTAKSQTFFVPDNYMNDSAFVTSGIVTDHSGSSTMTSGTGGTLYMLPQSPGTYIKLNFTAFDLGPDDQLQIINGLGSYGTSIGVFKAGNVPSVIYSSAGNGALTLILNVQSSHLYQGFSATIACVSSLPPADLQFGQWNGYNITQLAAGSEFGVQAHIKNGGVKAVPFTVSAYLSNDTLFNSGDVLVGTLPFDTLAGSESDYRYDDGIIPASTSPGLKYLLTVIDPLNTITESNESNNISWHPVTIISALNDLVFYGNSQLISGRPGSTIYLNASLINYGNCNLPSADIGIYISPDNIFDPSDIYCGITSTQPLSAPPSYSYGPTFRIPTGIPPGNYTMFMKADPAGLITETNESNNLFSIPLHLANPTYDLSIHDLYTAAEWNADGHFHISYQLKVTDFPTDQPFPVDCLLSTDSIADASDILLKNDTAVYNYYGTVTSYFNGTIPSIAPGNYYMLLYVDPGYLFNEVNENNNVKVTPIQIKPHEVDIVPGSINMDVTDIAYGGSVRFYFEISNRKGSWCPASQVKYYLSTDTMKDGSDVLIDIKAVPAIMGNSYNYIHDTITIPSSSATGTWYLLFVADPSNTIAETNELNNVIYKKITVSVPDPDLKPGDLYIPYNYHDTIPRGISLAFTTFVSNPGNWISNPGITDILLSSDEIADASDYLLSSISTPAIPSNNWKYISDTINFASSIPDGDYYILICADHTYTTTETKENNNTSFKKLVLGAGTSTIFNLSGNSHDVHTTCGELIYDSGGNGAYGNNENGALTLYPGISGNFIALDFIDMKIDECCDQLSIYDGPGFGDPLIGNFSSMPSRIVSSHSSGALTLRFISNASDVESGFKVHASCLASSTVDLSIEDYYYYSPEFVSGEEGQYMYELKNSGTRTAPASFTRLFLSADTMLDATDLYLKDDLSSHVLSGQNAYDDVKITIPVTFSPGDYYIIVQTDATALLAESNESNNTAYQKIIIHAPTVDLIPDYINFYVPGYYYPQPLYAGEDLIVSTTVINHAYKHLDTSSVSFYFSTDTLLDASDILIGNSYAGSAAPTMSFHHDEMYTIPSTMVPGDYYLLVKADAGEMFTELNESNNIGYMQAKLIEASTDLYTKYQSLSNYTPVSGGSTQLSFTMQNGGYISLPYGSMISSAYYFSNDTIIDASDIPVGGSSVTGTSSSVSLQTITVPAGLSPGDYYLIVKVDSGNVYAESNEQNNIFYFMLSIKPDVPDLSIEGLALSSPVVFEGSWFSYVYNRKNTGYGNAINAVLSYYLSADTIIDAGDTLMQSMILSLAGNSGSAMSASSLLPSGFTGNYYLILSFDENNTIAELSENNNVAFLPLNIQQKTSDFSIASFSSAVGSLSAAATSTITYSVQNTGNFYATNVSAACYLSADANFDGGDTYLNSSVIPWLYPNYPGTPASMNITIPAGTLTGSYYLLMVADHVAGIAETDESNNVSAIPLVISNPSRDLKINKMILDAGNVASGSSVKVTPYIFNEGSAATSSYNTGFYLSADNIYDAGDQFLGSHSMSLLNPGGIDSAFSLISIPAGIAAGDYFLISFADYQHTESETNESNNYIPQPLRVVTGIHDIVNSGVSVWTWGGGPTTVYYSLRNLGNLPDYYLNTQFYFSGDTLIDVSDVLMNTVTSTTLDPGAYLNGNFPLSYPAGTTYGTYYIISRTDPWNAISESNESNNLKYTVHRYYPDMNDFYIGELSAPDTLLRNVQTLISCRLSNYNMPVSSSPVGFYLSDDWLFDHEDLLLTSVDSGGMLNYEQAFVYTNITIPASTVPGIYYLIAAADDQNSMFETNENNNTVIHSVLVSNITGITVLGDNGFMIYPNPSAGNFDLKGNFATEEWGNELSIEVLNTSGKLIYREHFKNQGELQKHISLVNAENGLYLIRISGDGKSYCTKYLKIR
jgi:trimeric autotransporter adhesin